MLQIEYALKPWTGALRSSIETLMAMGGLSSALFRELSPIRLVTTGFLHTDILHLFTNMIALFISGRIIERSLGSHSLLPLFMIAVILGSFVSIQINASYDISIGASSGIMGIISASLILYLFHPHFKRHQDKPHVMTSALMIMLPSLLPLTRTSPYIIDMGAHVGGMIAGVVAGSILCFLGSLGINKRSLGRIPLLLTSLCIATLGYAAMTICLEYQDISARIYHSVS